MIEIAPNQNLTERLYISPSHVKAKVYNMFVIGENSCVTIIEDYTHNTHSDTEIQLASGAKLTYYKIQRAPQDVQQLSTVVVKQASNSQLNAHVVSFGAKTAQHELNVYLQGEGSACYLNGLYVAAANQDLRLTTNVYHQASHCISDQDYKGMVKGHARACFSGLVVVEKHLKQTVAKQQNKNLLLSRTAEVITKPQLEIYADDVVCSHGATVGQLDEDALFYFATRGIDENDAIKYLTYAFVEKNLRALPDYELAQQLFMEKINE